MFDSLKDWFYGLLYQLQSMLCFLIDFIKKIFFKLCGLDTVLVDGKERDLVSSLVQSNTVHRVFLTIMLIGVILLTVFVIIALIRMNYQTNEKKTRGTVIAKAGQSFLTMLLIPFIMLASMTLVNVIMSSINLSMQQYVTDGQTLIGGQMLITTGNNAFIESSGNREVIEKMFLTGELDYTKLSVVEKYYDLSQMNFVVGILGGLVMLVMFVISSITFIQRIFDIILLYIISPISASTIPLDDGNRFRVWKDMMIAKMLGAYGIILVMNLFFMIIPQVSQMTFFNNRFENGVVYILFLIGGAFAITKANLVISQLTGSQAGGREFAQMIYNFRSGIAFARATKGAVGAVVGRAIGGSDYLKNRKKGNGTGDSLKMSVNSTRNQTVKPENKKTSKAKQYGGAVTRLATMPAGVVKDMMQGGIIQAGKNFVPRLRNVATGSTFTSRAEVKPKKSREDKSANTTQNARKAEDMAKKITSSTIDVDNANQSSNLSTDLGTNTQSTDMSSTRDSDMNSTRSPENINVGVDTSNVPNNNVAGVNPTTNTDSTRNVESGTTSLKPEEKKDENNSEENKG